MRALPDPAFAFGDFVFVPKERLLLRGGAPVPLAAKAFDLLAILVRRSGHLVSKDELFEEVWPNTTVQETNLTVNISALRKALGGGRNGGEFIQTVPGVGACRRSRYVHHDRISCSLAHEAASNRCRVRIGCRAAFPK